MFMAGPVALIFNNKNINIGLSQSLFAAPLPLDGANKLTLDGIVHSSVKTQQK